MPEFQIATELRLLADMLAGLGAVWVLTMCIIIAALLWAAEQ